MRTLVFLLATLATAVAGWEPALPGWDYEFPRDHGNHPDFKTEWWYFTGNVEDGSGKEYGYQLTFFRQGVTPKEPATASRFGVRDIAFAHFAVSEPGEKRFRFFQEITRGAYGEAGFDEGRVLARIGEWNCELVGEHDFRLRAQAGDVAIDLLLEAEKAPVFHGADGVSQKSAGPGRASHYYSLTRLKTSGTIRTPKGESRVSGTSWFDHEWATNQLDTHQTGWDWFSLQFEEGSDLMIFQIRTKDGGRDVFSSGTFVDPEGRTTPIANEDFSLEPLETWRSPSSGAEYPVRWKLQIPRLELDLEIRAAFENQELVLNPITYWEGAIRVQGTLLGRPARAKGYLEMSGYGSPIVGMQASP